MHLSAFGVEDDRVSKVDADPPPSFDDDTPPPRKRRRGTGIIGSTITGGVVGNTVHYLRTNRRLTPTATAVGAGVGAGAGLVDHYRNR